MFKQKFYSDFFFIQILNFLIKPIWLIIIDRKIQNILPSDEYGIYFSINALVLIFSIILDLGLSQIISRETAKDNKFYIQNFWALLKFKIIAILLFSVLVITYAFILNLESISWQIIIRIALINILSSSVLFFRGFIQGFQLFKTDTLFSIMDRFILIIVFGTLIYVIPSSFNILFYLNIVLLVFLFLLLVVFIYCFSKFGFPIFSKMNQNFKSLFYQILPMIILILLMTIYGRLDSYLIWRLAQNGSLAASEYAKVFRLFEAASIPGLLLASQLMPLFSKNILDIKKSKTLLTTLFKIFVPFYIIIVVVLIICYAIILNWLYPNSDIMSLKLPFSLLMSSLIPFLLINIFGTYLTAISKIKTLILLAIIAVIVNASIAIVFLPNYGINAAAFAAFFGQLVFGFGCLLYSLKALKIGFKDLFLFNNLKITSFSQNFK